MKIANGRSATFNRVLIIGNQSIMGAGLEHLLSSDQTLDVFGIGDQSEAALLEEIWQLKPDTIILIFADQAISPCRLLEILEDYGRLRIILVSTESNKFDIYEKQPVIAQNQESLLSQLRLK